MRYFVIAPLILIANIAAIIGVYFLIEHRTTKKAFQILEVERRLDQLQENVASTDRSYPSLFSNGELPDIPALQFLKAISNTILDQIWLNEVIHNGKEGRIRGFAFSRESIDAFIQRLQKDPLHMRITQGPLKASTESSLAFELVCEFGGVSR